MRLTGAIKWGSGGVITIASKWAGIGWTGRGSAREGQRPQGICYRGGVVEVEEEEDFTAMATLHQGRARVAPLIGGWERLSRLPFLPPYLLTF